MYRVAGTASRNCSRALDLKFNELSAFEPALAAIPRTVSQLTPELRSSEWLAEHETTNADLPLAPLAAHSFTVRCIVYVAYVGRRSRQVAEQRQVRQRNTGARMARIHVDDETWAAYRVLLGSTPVGFALGRLVEREVAAHRRRTALDADGVREAVASARTVVADLERLVERLERSD